jgi:hypothetical protein
LSSSGPAITAPPQQEDQKQPSAAARRQPSSARLAHRSARPQQFLGDDEPLDRGAALDRRDHRLVQVLQRVGDPVNVVGQVPLAAQGGGILGQVAQVGAGAERAARPGQHDGADAAVGAQADQEPRPTWVRRVNSVIRATESGQR